MKNFRRIFTALVMAYVFSIQGMEEKNQEMEEKKLTPTIHIPVTTEIVQFFVWINHDMLITKEFFDKMQQLYAITKKDEKTAKLFLEKTLAGLRAKERNRNSVYYGHTFEPRNLKNKIYSWIEKKLDIVQTLSDDYSKRIYKKPKKIHYVHDFADDRWERRQK